MRNKWPAEPMPGVATGMKTVPPPFTAAARLGWPSTMRGRSTVGGAGSVPKLAIHSSASTAPSASRRSASKRSGSCSRPSGAARVRSGRPESQVKTAFTVDAPSPPPSGRAAARVRWFRVATVRLIASRISAPCAGSWAVSYASTAYFAACSRAASGAMVPAASPTARPATQAASIAAASNRSPSKRTTSMPAASGPASDTAAGSKTTTSAALLSPMPLSPMPQRRRNSG